MTFSLEGGSWKVLVGGGAIVDPYPSRRLAASDLERLPQLFDISASSLSWRYGVLWFWSAVDHIDLIGERSDRFRQSIWQSGLGRGAALVTAFSVGGVHR